MNMEDRITKLEKRITALELQLQAQSKEVPVIVSADGEKFIQEYFANRDI